MKKCCKSTIECVKDESTRESVKCSSNTVALMINQTLLSHSKGESLRTKMATQPVSISSSQNSNNKPKMARNKIAYKRTQSFQPCETCKQIIEHRKKLFIEFRSTPETTTDGMVTSESITTQATVDQPHSDREDGVFTAVHLPTIGSDTADDSKLEQRFKVSFKACDSDFAKQRSKSCLEKSYLVKSKERIEELLQTRRKHLHYLVSS